MLGNPRVVTALPVYNEVTHIADVVAEVQQYADHVLVVDDGSTDGTADLLKTFDDVTVITHPENRGYGAALASAFDYTIANEFDALVTIDCDGQHQPKLIPEMVSALFAEHAPEIEIISGSRYLKQFDGDSLPPEDRRAINMEITRKLNRDHNWNLTDTFCGFKAYRRAALEKFEITEFGYAMPLQLWLQAAVNEMRIEEFPVPLIYLEEVRSFGGSLDNARRRMAHYQDVIRREEQRLRCGSPICCSHN